MIALAEIIHRALVAAGIPIDGVVNRNGTDAGVTIQFRPEATPEQRIQAEAIADDVIAHPEAYT